MFKPVGTVYLVLIALLFAGSAAAPVFSETYEEAGKKHSWLSWKKPAKDTPAEQMLHAQDLLKRKKTKKAARAFHSLVLTWPGSAEAPMAQWAYAKVLDARGDELKAFDEYQVLMENYTGRFPDYEKALRRQFEIATNVIYKKRGGFLFFGGFEAPERAIPYLEKVIENGPRSAFAPRAQYLIGKAYEDSFKYDMAVVSYISTLHRYPLSPQAEPAAFGRARALSRISDSYPNDLEALDEAWAGIMVFMRAYPNSEFIGEATEIRDRLIDRKAENAFNVARFYDTKKKNPRAALESYRDFVRRYPNSRWTDKAQERIIKLSSRLDGPEGSANE